MLLLAQPFTGHGLERFRACCTFRPFLLYRIDAVGDELACIVTPPAGRFQRDVRPATQTDHSLCTVQSEPETPELTALRRYEQGESTFVCQLVAPLPRFRGTNLCFREHLGTSFFK